MATYRVRAGYRHGKDGQYGPGDNIELSVEEASGFLDKLEMVAEPAEATADEPWRGLDAKVVIALEAGGVTPAMVPTLGDDELLSVAGIGAASLAKIRAAFNG